MLEEVQQRILAACDRSGRRPRDVQLVAVTKGHDIHEIQATVLSCGHHVLGENRIQEWRDKARALTEVEWHFIGNLQTNKAKYCSGFALIHSLNSMRLADALQQQGEKRDHLFRVLVEVNVAGETSKRGAGPEEAEELVAYARSLPHLQVRGLMTMAPYSPDPERARPHFRKLRELRDRLGLEELSMGMSGDYEVAIEEGATIVRVGSAIFQAKGAA